MTGHSPVIFNIDCRETPKLRHKRPLCRCTFNRYVVYRLLKLGDKLGDKSSVIERQDRKPLFNLRRRHYRCIYRLVYALYTYIQLEEKQPEGLPL